MTRHTGEPTRDLSRATHETPALPHSGRLLAVIEGEEEDDRTLGRIFGVPSGLVVVET